MDTSSLSSQLLTPVGIFVIALCCRAIFSFLETSITALRLFKLKELAASVNKYRLLFQTLEKNPQQVIITILIASSVSDVILASLATKIAATIFSFLRLSSSIGFSFGVGLASITIILFGDIIPKNFARSRGPHFLPSILWFINGLFHLLYPLVSVLMQFADMVMYKLDTPANDHGEWVSSEREIRFLIDYIHEKGMLEIEKTEMLRNIFELGDKPVKDIMVSVSDIISVNIDRTPTQVLEVFSKHRFTRLPVYKERPDNVVGMIHLKDVFVLLLKQNILNLQEIIRPIMMVPDTIKVNQLLRQFRKEHIHIAMVINEHGIVTGLITLEDILEEIVGEITDEHESFSSKIMTLKDDSWLIEGNILLEDLSAFLNISLKTDHAVTLSGFLIEQFQHMPRKGERYNGFGYQFTVHKVSQRRILQVIVSKNTLKIGVQS
ncbi:HlyC/CorC family transporter [bacterium]|nr:MAG: HlyC/CorC family transporter [bacterium]QQR61383.1 MAG: HlyC/CorC family transporter [bacterium]QQR63097.1 MAG: HlyC/CorC family transporter [bacterium]